MEIEAMLSTISTIGGFALGVGSLVYAIKTNREKADLENFAQTTLAQIAGNIEVIRESSHWAGLHFQGIRNEALKLESSEQVKAILARAHDGARDATAAERMLGNLFTEVLALQRGQFRTEEVYRPDRKAD